MSLSSFFSSFLPTVYADAPADDKEESKPEESTSEESTSEESKDEEPKDEEAGGEEEEEEEPEDVRSSHSDRYYIWLIIFLASFCRHCEKNVKSPPSAHR